MNEGFGHSSVTIADQNGSMVERLKKSTPNHNAHLFGHRKESSTVKQIEAFAFKVVA